jgi:hypothetical protein
MSAKNEEIELKANTNSIIMGQLISISYQMMMFDITKEKTKILMEKFIKFHILNEQHKEELMKCIDNYTKEVPLVYNKNIENNFGGKRSEGDEEEVDVVIIKNN